jgi:hypothetical protein
VTRPKRRGSGASAVALAALAGSCGARGPAFESVPTLPDAGQHAPGVSVDPAGELPVRTQKAHTETTVVVLESPMDPATIRAVVRAYFHAVVEESPSELDAVLMPRAVVTTRSRQLPAREHLLSRFARYDYGALRGSAVYREESLEISEPDPADARERAARAGLDPDAGQRIVRVPIASASHGQKRLFGDDVTLRLVARDASFVIAEIVEEF